MAKTRTKIDNKVWQFLCSVKLAVIIIIVLAVACIAGTLVLQQRTHEDYVNEYGEGLTTFFNAIQFTDIFHSYWFAFLLVLLCVNLGCCTIKRWRNTILQIGFLLTHVSIILTMIGCFIDLQFGEKGGVNVYEGQSVDYYLRRADYKKIPLGFEVFCDDFLIERHAPKYKLVTYVKDKDKQKIVPVKVGTTVKIPGSNYSIEFKEYYTDAEYVQEPVNLSSEPNNPAIYVRLSSPQGITAEGWLPAKDHNWYKDQGRDLKVEYLWTGDDEYFEKLAKTAGESAQPKVEIVLEEKNIQMSVPLKVGEEHSIDGTDYKIAIKEFALDFSGKSKPLHEQAPTNPAVRVEINGPQGIESRWAFSKLPDYIDKAHGTKYKEIKLSCFVPDDYPAASNRLKIIQSKSGKQTFLFIKDNQIISTTNWELNEFYNLEEMGLQLKIVNYFPSYSFKKKVVQRTGNHEGHNHGPGEHVGTPAIRIEVDGPRGKAEAWVLAQNQAVWYLDRNFALLYESSGMAVKDYKSILRVVENGKTVKTKTIEVNDPLKHKGYVFYQSSYDPEGERYTGLQVTKNPGLAVVYTGFIILCVGVVFIFYVKPFIRRKGRKDKIVESFYDNDEDTVPAKAD